MTSFVMGSMAGSGAGGGGRFMGAETGVNNELIKNSGLAESDGRRGWFGARSWIQGEDVETFSLAPL